MIPDLPPDTIPAALAAWLVLKVHRCESRIEEIALAQKLPGRKRNRWRAALFVGAIVLFTVLTGNSQKAVRAVNNVSASLANQLITTNSPAGL